MIYLKDGKINLDNVIFVLDFWRKRDVLKALDETDHPKSLKIMYDPETRNFSKAKSVFPNFTGVYIAVVDKYNLIKFFYMFSYECSKGMNIKDLYKIFEKYNLLEK
ncbi:MAG: hypothetical protein JXR48_02960 [Candidatus Delongbacteria bacterium]|nr:hypothetical protein [Candidatus Delongbacteria bacterium]MBN2833908.1 hypothetical protein [Candidatus Delongbacteria bacterium]